MQVQKIQNNNTNFGATLKVHNMYEKLEKPVVEFLEVQFPKRTGNISGRLDYWANGTPKDLYYPDTLVYTNNKYKDSIKIECIPRDSKETLLEGLVNSLNGFIIREQAQNKIEELKREIVETGDRAFKESIDEFRKTFMVMGCSAIGHDIAPKGSCFGILISRSNYCG